jgi:uncharacterized protein (TIGR02271 family)
MEEIVLRSILLVQMKSDHPFRPAFFARRRLRVASPLQVLGEEINFLRRLQMINRVELHNGMIVRSADGDKLGRIIAIDDRGIQLEKGIFFPKEYHASFDQADQVSNGDLYLKWGTHLVEEQFDSFYGAGSYRKETEDGEQWTDYKSATFGDATETYQRIPLREEDVRVNQKGMRDTGRVRIYKTVRTEDQHFSVPVRREEVHIERVPGTGQSVTSDDANIELKDDTVTIPIREEQVEVTKRPKVREEIPVHKTSNQVGQEVCETVKKEDVRIEKDDDYLDPNDHDAHP